MKKAFLILPNHLFEHIHDKVRQSDSVFIIEEPMHFYDLKDRPFRYNKVKLAYLRASMKAYNEYLLSKSLHVQYIDYDQVSTYEFLKGFDEVGCYDPCDMELLTKYNKLKMPLSIIPNSPMFLSTPEWNATYAASKKGKHMSNADFYKFLRKKLKILEGVRSYDSDNRKSLPPGFTLEDDIHSLKSTGNSKYYNEAISYINKHKMFKDNIGQAESVVYYPVTFKDAKAVLSTFLKTKLRTFGTYQDAIDKNSVFVYHSCLSAALNVGIITPAFVVQTTLEYYNEHKQVVQMNNLEGFIRQLFWREFMYMIYTECYDELIGSNQFSSVNKLKWEKWYGGTGLSILDAEITKCIKYGYAHHIVRLMVFLNIFVLLQVDPHNVKRWFMEVCATDAYDWVMVSNLWAMGYYTPRFMTKPYISTEGYLLKMSNYKKKECPIWKALYYKFLVSNRKKLTGSSSILLRNLKYFDGLTSKEQGDIMQAANAFSKTVLS